MNDDRYCRRRRMTNPMIEERQLWRAVGARLIRSCSLGRILSSAWVFIYMSL